MNRSHFFLVGMLVADAVLAVDAVEKANALVVLPTATVP